MCDEQPPHRANAALRHRTSSELAVSSEHETLLAAAVVVVGTRAVTARCMAANGRARADEQELWMVCSIMSAALACESACVGTQGTQISKTVRAFDSGSSMGNS